MKVQVRIESNEELIKVLQHLEDNDFRWSCGERATEYISHPPIYLIINLSNHALTQTAVNHAYCNLSIHELFSFDFSIKYCEKCGKPINENDDCEHFNGDDYHVECLDEITVTCVQCGERIFEDDTIYFGDEFYCDNCIEDVAVRCDDCGEWCDEDCIHQDGFGNSVCDSCYDWRDYSTCDECGRITTDIYYHEDDDEYLCYCCHESKPKAIKSYNYKPSPIFHGVNSKLFMGVELEVDGEGESHSNAQTLIDIANADDEHIYCKHDGSLDDGFEIVSHPATLEYHTNCIPWRTLMQEAVEIGYRSHQTSTCGLHVHISKKALGSTEIAIDENTAKLIYFVESHWNELVKFSRRTKYNLDRWARRYGIESTVTKVYEKAKNERDYNNRYVAINLQNAHTIEFRLFRGTLKYSTFLATLQLVENIVHTAVILTESDIERQSWSDFVKNIDNSKYPELVEYLKVRELYVNELVDEVEEDM